MEKYIKLSFIGYSNYYLTDKCRLYKTAPTVKEIKKDKKNCFYLIDDSGKGKRINTRKLYY